MINGPYHILFATNPPQTKVEDIRKKFEAHGRNLMVLPLDYLGSIQKLSSKAAELIREKVTLQKALRSKFESRFFTESERNTMSEQIQDLEGQITAIITRMESCEFIEKIKV